MDLNIYDFEQFCLDNGFKIEEFQLEIMDLVFTNLENGNKMQVVLMPKGSGKTILSLLLGSYLQTRDMKASLYSCFDTEATLPPYAIASKALKLLQEGSLLNPLKAARRNNTLGEIVAVDGFADIEISDSDLERGKSLIDLMNTDFYQFFDSTSSSDFEVVGFFSVGELVKKYDSQLVIFDTKDNYKKYCNNSMNKELRPIVIDYFPNIDKYVTEYEKELRTYDEHEESLNLQTIYQLSMKSYLDDKFNMVNSKLDEISTKIDEIRKVQQEIQQEVSTKKYSINAFKEFTDDISSLDAFTDQILNKLSIKIGETIKAYEKMNSYQQYKKLMEVRMGENAWNKLDDESKRFIVTAKFTFSENMLLEQDIDYSSICLLVSKAFEIELAKRLITKYENYLNSIYGARYFDWPSAVIKKDRNGKERPITVEDFTLGNCSYIFGFLPKNNYEADYNKKCFIQFCMDELLDLKDNKQIENYLRELDSKIRKIKDSYRNPAAHKDSITMIEASECMDYVLEVERVLKKMLEKFMY